MLESSLTMFASQTSIYVLTPSSVPMTRIAIITYNQTIFGRVSVVRQILSSQAFFESARKKPHT